MRLVRIPPPGATTYPVRADIAFDRASYRVGDQIRSRVTLTNTGTNDLPGITARCAEMTGEPNELSSTGWGDLAHPRQGVTLAAGQTKVFEVSDTVPAAARTYGYVVANCVFVDGGGRAYSDSVWTEAAVPGAVGAVGGTLFYDANGDGERNDGPGPAGVTVCLRARYTDAVVARTVTDSAGHFWFRDVPAGRYRLCLFGPWKVADNNGKADVFGDRELDGHDAEIVPGADVVDPDAPVSTPPTPAPQARPAPESSVELAATGVDPRRLSLLGLSLLVAGAGLVLAGRRRRPC